MRILFQDLFTFIIKDNQTKMESFISIRPPSPLTHLLVHGSTGPGFQGTELVEVPGVSGFQGTEPVEVPGGFGIRVSGFAFKDQRSRIKAQNRD